MKTKLSIVTASLLLATTLFTGCAEDGKDGTAGTAGVTGTTGATGNNAGSIAVDNKQLDNAAKITVLTAYADAALSDYNASLTDANALVTAINNFDANTTQDNMDAVKTAWLKSRESYGVTEIYRLSNGPIDGEETFSGSFGAPEGQLNAWPLDENMIDYTTDETGATTSGNIIDATANFTPESEDNSSTAVDVSDINATSIAALNENGGDANVATGYHAIEFLVWGQDQDYASKTADAVTNGALEAGARPLTDYTTADNADRRMDYLKAASALIVSDLQSVVNAWTSGAGSYREAFLNAGTNAIATDDALKQVMAGMGVFIKSELANERMAVAIQTPSEEDEHSCFSDNTHRDIALNYKGFTNALVETGMLSYTTPDTQIAVKSLIRTIDSGVDVINVGAVQSEHFDYQIKASSSLRENAYDTKNNMRDLGDLMINVAKDYGISLEDSDVTDGEESEVSTSL